MISKIFPTSIYSNNGFTTLGMPNKIIITGIIAKLAIENIVSLLLLPSQKFRNITAITESKRAIENSDFSKDKVKFIEIPIGENNLKAILYSRDAQSDISDSVILHHNPQAATVANYFINGTLLPHTALGQLVKWFNLPMIFYDYRAAGLNSDGHTWNDILPFATPQSLIEDGKAVLTYALKHYKNVLIIGSSLGGGVGTLSLNEYLKENPSDAKRAWLINHDSFTTIPRVVLPKYPNLADNIGWVVGAQLDASNAMENLLKLDVPVAIFCHDLDPIIPAGARMANWVENLPKSAFHSSPSICRDNTHAVHVSLDPSFIENCAASTDPSSISWLHRTREKLSTKSEDSLASAENDPFVSNSNSSSSETHHSEAAQIEETVSTAQIPITSSSNSGSSETHHSEDVPIEETVSTAHIPTTSPSNSSPSETHHSEDASIPFWVGFASLATIGSVATAVFYRLYKNTSSHPVPKREPGTSKRTLALKA